MNAGRAANRRAALQPPAAADGPPGSAAERGGARASGAPGRRPASPAAAAPSAADDEALLGEWIREHRAYLARLAQRLLGWPAEVDDVLQDVFVAAWRARSRFRAAASPRTWLTRIAINACRSRQRRWARLRQWFTAAAAALGVAASRSSLDGTDLPAASGVAGDPDALEALRVAVRALPQAEREAVVLCYLEDLPAADAAELLGIRRGTLDVRLNRARTRLRAHLRSIGEGES